MSQREEPLKIYLRLAGEVADRFERIKESMGLKADTEVVRSLIAWYWKTHQDELIPQLLYINADDQGVKIFDRTIGQTVDVNFRPEGIKCSYCQNNNCRHVKFSLDNPNVKRIVTKKRKEGWKLPEV